MAEQTTHVNGGGPTRLHALRVRGVRNAAAGQLWLEPAHSPLRFSDRDIGGRPAPHPVPRYRLGSRLRLGVESARAGHLLLLNEGTTGTVYCLCPSWFAPHGAALQPRAEQPGWVELPRDWPPEYPEYAAFELSGRPGREHVLAILTEERLALNWLPPEPTTPAHIVTPTDLDTLLAWLDTLGEDRWWALATAFDLVL